MLGDVNRVTLWINKFIYSRERVRARAFKSKRVTICDGNYHVKNWLGILSRRCWEYLSIYLSSGTGKRVLLQVGR